MCGGVCEGGYVRRVDEGYLTLRFSCTESAKNALRECSQFISTPPEPQLMKPSPESLPCCWCRLSSLPRARGAGEEEGRVERGANDTTHARQRQVSLLLAAQRQPRAHTARTRLERDEVAPLCASSPAILTLRVSLLVQIMLPTRRPRGTPTAL